MVLTLTGDIADTGFAIEVDKVKEAEIVADITIGSTQFLFFYFPHA